MDSADELMGYLPPVGWADVATKSNLEMIRLEMNADITELRFEMLGAMSALSADLKGWLLASMITMLGVMSAIVFGAVKFVH